MASLLLLGLVPVLFALGMSIGGKYAFHVSGTQDVKPRPWLVWLAMATMLVIRLLLAASMEGYSCDVQTFQAWAVRAAENLSGFYSGGFFADYPPGYMYVLFLIGKLKELLDLPDGGSGFLALIKLPAIIADMLTTFLLYRLANLRFGKKAALAVALMYGFNPAVILDSAVWGQVDAVFTLFIVLSIFFLTGNHLASSVSWFVVALLIKPQALIFTPLLLASAVDRLLLQPVNGIWTRILVAAAAGGLVFMVGVAPFALEEGPLWVFDHYRATLTSYPYATVNAYNLFALSGANFTNETASWLFFPYRSWGTLFIVLATLFAFRVYFCASEETRLYLMGMFIIAAVFIFSARMHERYLFPVLIFALLAALYAGSMQLLVIFTGFSITHYINVVHVLIASTRGITHIPGNDPLLLGTSMANLLLFLYMLRCIARSWSNQEGRLLPE
ncbi:membrane protein [Geotalea daltonii FRC-32]|uniref:Membrane protein n=1 Tax=Geotalea daltonii (strain DSM 22248 / JCM 15807 / FRC-32) TaxID=316067 RepID=B9M9D1_GEODF|nr:glycosyltransferase family 39 protein [Geotalea daltonii]ACM18689.1 membrane protein [Geotalea daltonii FRC-32]